MITAESAVLLLALLILSSIDIRHRRLPDILTLPLIAIGLALSTLHDGGSGLASAALAAAIGFLAFFAVAHLYRKTRGQDGLGLGDAKLLAAAGAWLGPFWLAPVVFIGATLALIIVLFLRLGGRSVSLTTRIPFGPFIAVGFFSCWLLQTSGWAAFP